MSSLKVTFRIFFLKRKILKFPKPYMIWVSQLRPLMVCRMLINGPHSS